MATDGNIHPFQKKMPFWGWFFRWLWKNHGRCSYIIIYQFLDFEFTSPGRGDELVQFRPGHIASLSVFGRYSWKKWPPSSPSTFWFPLKCSSYLVRPARIIENQDKSIFSRGVITANQLMTSSIYSIWQVNDNYPLVIAFEKHHFW